MICLGISDLVQLSDSIAAVSGELNLATLNLIYSKLTLKLLFTELSFNSHRRLLFDSEVLQIYMMFMILKCCFCLNLEVS